MGRPWDGDLSCTATSGRRQCLCRAARTAAARGGPAGSPVCPDHLSTSIITASRLSPSTSPTGAAPSPPPRASMNPFLALHLGVKPQDLSVPPARRERSPPPRHRPWNGPWASPRPPGHRLHGPRQFSRWRRAPAERTEPTVHDDLCRQMAPWAGHGTATSAARRPLAGANASAARRAPPPPEAARQEVPSVPAIYVPQ